MYPFLALAGAVTAPVFFWKNPNHGQAWYLPSRGKCPEPGVTNRWLAVALDVRLAVTVKRIYRLRQTENFAAQHGLKPPN